MGYIIATANMKGGVGKTTLSVNLATALVKEHRQRVLVVDLDTQISATLSLMPPPEFAKFRKRKQTLRYLVEQIINPVDDPKFSSNDVVQHDVCNLKGLDLLPGDIDLYDEFVVSQMLYQEAIDLDKCEFEIVWNRFERFLLKKILQPLVPEYDFIILDCAPGYNLLTRSALVASDFYILPAKPEPLSVVGIQLLERRIISLKESHKNEQLLNVSMLGIVFTMSGNLLTGRYYRQVIQRVNQDFGAGKLFNTNIPLDVNVAKAVDSFMPVVLSSPNTAGAKAFNQLTQEFLEKLKTVAEVK